MAREKKETDVPEHLKQNPILQHLDIAELKKVVELSERKTYKAGDFVFKQNEAATKLYFVDKGRVGIIMQPTSTRQVTVSTESRGGVFGWSALLHPRVYTAAAKCFEDCELLALEGTKLRELCYREPRLGVKVMEGLASLIAARLDSTRLQLMDMWE